jgi:hypothetical protein
MVKMRWFRKHQKVMLVFFGVILMIIFVLGSALPWFGSGGGGPGGSQQTSANQTVVKWNGGSLNRFQFSRLKNLHFAALRFQEQLVRQAQAQAGKNWPGIRTEPISGIDAKPESEDFDRQLFRRFMLAQFAHDKLDMVISDQLVNDYLYLISDLSLSQQDLFNVNMAANSQAVDFRDILEYIKLELAAMRVDDLLSVSVPFLGLLRNPTLSNGSPADQFLAYLQTEKRFECVVKPFAVADYLGQVKAGPTGTQIRALYEQGRNLLPQERANQPGFKRPRKLAVEFLRADFQTFQDRAIQDVTKEQVLQEYNRLVEAKDPLVMEDIPQTEGDAVAPNPEGEGLQDPEGDGDLAPAPEGGEMTEEAPAGDAANPTAPSAGNEAAPPPAEKKPADDDGSQPAGKTDSAADDAAPTPGNQDEPSSDDGGGTAQIQPTEESSRYVSVSIQSPSALQEPQPEQQEPADAPGEKPADEPADQPVPQESTENPPASEPAPTQNEPATSGQMPATQEAGDDQPADAAAPGQAAPQDSTQTPPSAADKPPLTGPQEPLIPEKQQRPKKLDEELELSIKRRMKAEEAGKEMQKMLDKVQAQMQQYHDLLMDYEFALEQGEDDVEKPKPIDFRKLADECRLTYGSTDLVDYLEFQETEIGKSVHVSDQVVRIADELFSTFDTISLHAPFVPTAAFTGESYVFWVTDKRESVIPKLDEARREIIDYWKKQEAYKLALADAEQVAQRARQNNEKILETFADTARQTGEFSWFSRTPPLNVELPGEEFLSLAFHLKENEIGVAPNFDQSIVYLVQKTKEDPRSAEQLRDQFLKEVATFKRPWNTAVVRRYSGEAAQDWTDFVQDEMGVQWLAY